MKKQKPQVRHERIKLRVKEPGKIMAALVHWAEASEELGLDVLGLDEAPQWTWNALGEVIKVVLRRRGVPKDGEWDVEFVGELFGRLVAIARVYLGEIPMGPTVEGEYEKYQKQSASGQDSLGKMVARQSLTLDFRAWLKNADLAIRELMSRTLKSSHEHTLGFQEGLLRGMSVNPDELSTGPTFQQHTRTFLVLLLYWRYWANCRSVREIYQHLCKAVGEKKVGSFKTFENHVARRIGLRVRGRGRPKSAR